MSPKVLIDYFPAHGSCESTHAVVAIDVIRATTTAITAVSQGRRCFPVTSVEAAHELAAKLEAPLLIGELGGEKPPSFDMNNSPAALAARTDRHRPAILLSSSGTQLLASLRMHNSVYVACFRNFIAIADELKNSCVDTTLLGAGTHGEFREEDQMCCAWIADELVRSGYEPANRSTADIVLKWRRTGPDACLAGKSAKFLTRTNQLQDLRFILASVNDLNLVCSYSDGEISAVRSHSLAAPVLGI
jgi:Phosphosulfolactate phosphohydrolase and related enzymes